MAKLFLSYSRKDETKARRLAEWLEREGHDVWRDEDDIGGGESFSAEIEKALNESDAVLVLWSADAVESPWVRDEAGFGRDAGKLIPLTLDGTAPPLGFRQFQAIGLSKWARGTPPGAERIKQAIERLTSGASGPRETAHAPSPRRFQKISPKLSLVGGLVALLVVAGIGLFLWPRWSTDQQIAIAVLPSPQSPDRGMATDYANVAAADMAAFLPRRFDRAIVIAAGDANGPTSGYRMLVFTDPHGVGANATLTLSDEDGRTTLWSKNWSVADINGADLKADVSASASKVALCLTEARGGRKRLFQPALGLYLSGCAGLGDTQLSNADFVSIFERITKLAPDFAPAWGYLALSRSWIAEGLENSAPAAHAAAVQSARDAIATARRLDPNSALTYDAEYHLISNDSLRALQVLDQGARADPDYGMVQMHLSTELRGVGRMADSVDAAQRAVELEPGAPYATSQYILALMFSGEFSKAKDAAAKAQEKWPNDLAINFAEFQLQSRYGDARRALVLLPRIMQSSDAAMIPYRKMIEARLDPSAAKVDDAIAALRASSEPSSKRDLLVALGNFGRVDQVYQLLDDASFRPFVQTSLLFEPDFAGVRADPRFMEVAARFGLVRYWRQTGYWPDFCTGEKLPYDCKTEAAKYGS